MNNTTEREDIIRNLSYYETENGRYSFSPELKQKYEKLSTNKLEELWDEEKRKAWYERIKKEVLIKLAIKQRGEATELIVTFLKEFHTFKTTRSDQASEIWIYKEGIYLPEGKTYIEEIARDMLKNVYTSQIIKNVVDKIMADTYIDQETFFEQQNSYPYLIPVKNGLLDLKTLELKSFTNEIAFFNKLSMEYQPESKCPNFIKFVKEITGNEEDINVIQEMFGYCLIKEYKYEKAFMLYGSHGRNGKSKLLEILKRMIGVENVTNVSLESIEKDHFSMSEMHNKMINISADISKEAINNTGNFKSLTGRDQLLAARKFKNGIKFVNYAKMIFAANDLPPINDSNSDAFWLRWVLIEFPHQFLPEKELKNNEDARLQDPIIVDKILSNSEEMEGILNWSLEGLHRLEANKDFSYTNTAKDVKLDWMKKSNSVAAFIYDFVDQDYSGEILKQEFKRVYLEYCKKNRLKVLSDKVIKITLEKEVSAATSSEQINVDGQYKKFYYWSGIVWKKSGQKTL